MKTYVRYRHPRTGVRRVDPSNGYARLYQPEHPNATVNGYVYEHTAVASRALGKPIPKGAQVHHVDEDRGNNAPTNLVICQDAAYHRLIHQRTDALRATGNANMRRCTYCQTWSLPGSPDFHFTSRIAFHRDCRLTYRRANER